MGENVMLSGENRDRTKLTLPGRQEEYVNALVATGKPVILVVFGGRAQVISNLAKEMHGSASGLVSGRRRRKCCCRYSLWECLSIGQTLCKLPCC